MEDIRGEFETYHKRDIAMQYFKLALSEYVEGKNMFAVIHLAGAAEEMLGKLVSLQNKETAFERAQRLTRAFYKSFGKKTPKDNLINKHILKIKNGVKHINDGKDLEIQFDIKREAKELICRAIDNFNHLPELKRPEELLAYYKSKKHSKAL